MYTTWQHQYRDLEAFATQLEQHGTGENARPAILGGTYKGKDFSMAFQKGKFQLHLRKI